MTRQVSRRVGLLALAFVACLSPQFEFLNNQIQSAARTIASDIRDELSGYTGTAYATQWSNTSDYDKHFGANWQSVRTFRLMRQLDAPIRIWVDTGSHLYKPHYTRYVADSLKSWSTALEGRLLYTFVNNPKQADIKVTWVPSFSDRYVAGITTYRVGSAKIEMKSVGVPEADLKANIIHEVGHALGISGHSNNSDDIMVGVRRWTRGGHYEPKLSQRDILAIRRLYSNEWSKGEDLYVALAKQPPVRLPSLANQDGKSQVIMVKPMAPPLPTSVQKLLPAPSRNYKQIYPNR